MPTVSHRPFIIRIGNTFADLLFLALILGSGAKLLWYNDIVNTKLVGFIFAGSEIAAVLSYFSFVLFGILYYARHAGSFWRTLHPANFGLAMILLPRHSLTDARSILIFCLAILIGAGIALGVRQTMSKYPRWFLSGCAGLLLGGVLLRYAAPSGWREVLRYDYGSYFVTGLVGLGGFLITTSLGLNFLDYKRK